jgi:hypothetical protein
MKLNELAFPLNGISLGLSKREYFSALAMQGIQASNFQNERQDGVPVEIVAAIAVKQADALIEELNKTKEE